jgi:hypothetical protein
MGTPGRARLGKAAGLTTDERQRLKELERENRELKRANEIPRKASAFFAQAELDCRPKWWWSSLRTTVLNRGGVDLQCVAVSPSTFYRDEARHKNPERLPARSAGYSTSKPDRPCLGRESSGLWRAAALFPRRFT